MKDYQLNMRAPGKVNYILEIGAKRDDGFHEILTVFQTVSLSDMLYFKTAPREITVTTNAENIGPVEQNLVYKAAQLLKKRYNLNKGATIFLQKNIPHGAGLGGGSSDAAAALRGLARLWELKMTRDDLARFALQLGSDVPFFLEGGLAIARGRGEKITPVSRHVRPQLVLVLVYPDISIATEWAYRTWDTEGFKSRGKGIDVFMKALYKSDIKGLAGALFNDFEHLVLAKYPQIQEIKNTLMNAGALGTLMSGSGSTVYGVFPGNMEADAAVVKLESAKVGKVFKVITS